LKILAIGDVFGHAGRDIVYHELSGLKKELNADFMIVNFENASGGNGVSEANARELLAVSSVDVYTSGNHIWDKKDILKVIGNERILRPANYPGDCPGRGYGIYETPTGVVGVSLIFQAQFLWKISIILLSYSTRSMRFCIRAVISSA
jgi:calcineurin-like phosphoesterase